MIDFELDDEQLALQRSARDFFERRCPIATVRAVEDGEPGYMPDVWSEMAGLGWLGITFPEAYGGTGGSLLDLYGLHEEIGRSLVPSPFLDTVVVAGELLLATGSEDQRRLVLPSIVDGTGIVSLALIEPDGGFGPSSVTMEVIRRGDDYVLNGTKLLVGFAPSAAWFLCAVRTAGNSGAEGISVFLVDAHQPGISWTRLPNIAGGALYALDFREVVTPGSSLVGRPGAGWSPLADAITRGAVLQTASIVGAAQKVLEMTNQYAKDRVQFGNPIGRYQAVQYMVSDILLDLHRTNLLARHAAYRIHAGMPYVWQAGVAVSFGKKAAAHLHRQAHEVHGGIGYILDHDLNLYSRRSKFWENNLGDAHYYEDQLATVLGI
jgi:alkylation response protein AidB-like acyl-CoA dehydrogenase